MKPWEMDWSHLDQQTEQKPKGKKPWEMDWNEDGTLKQSEPAQQEEPAIAEPDIADLDRDLRV